MKAIMDTELNLVVNDTGNEYYKKMKKDSSLSLFVAGPASLIFVEGCLIMIAGFTLKLFLISIWPLILIGLAFFYTAFFGRKKYFSNAIRRISVNQDRVTFETFKWFNYKPVVFSASIGDIAIKVWNPNYQEFFDNKTFLINFKNSDAVTFYLVEEFFDNTEGFLKLLGKEGL
jgi:hypothetical protein